jgi:DNA-binding HxlR family transcriptional regulator
VPSLSLLAMPLVPLILRALGDRPMRLAELGARLGAPPQTTLRDRLDRLTALGALARRGAGMPYAVHHQLTAPGAELLELTEVLDRWLHRAPGGPRPIATVTAKGSVRALLDAWQSTALRALAARPLSLTQLDSLIAAYSYPSLERRLAAMRATGLVEARPPKEGATPYAVTPWARQAVAPIAAALRFERRHLSALAPPLRPLDLETAFLLATPIAALPARLDGSCLLAARLGEGRDGLHGVRVAVDRGAVVECLAQLDPRPPSWAIGPDRAWLDALLHRHTAELRTGGDRELACGLIFGIHDALHDRLIRSKVASTAP